MSLPTLAHLPRVKYVLISGGVCSSIGKGVTTSSLGALFRASGYRVTAVKVDPYINVDAGLMSPLEHGEVYVLADGGEVDLDLGNYERWMSLSLTRDNNITTGKMYQTLIKREREGKYLGKTVTLVPHFTNEVVAHIQRVAQESVDGSGLRPHVCLVEMGGTVGDFESAPFIEALRSMRFTLPPEDFALVHCTYLPVMGGCQKTKPTQHSCRKLLSLGLSADFLVCRSESPLEGSTREKLSQMCGIRSNNIVDARNVKCLYDVPALFSEQQFIPMLVERLQLNTDAYASEVIPQGVPDLATFAKFSHSLKNPKKIIRIAFVGKYLDQGTDAYFSVIQAFEHACLALGVGVEYVWVNSELLQGKEAEVTEAAVKGADGIYVPGGFGSRGVEGKIRVAQIARENNIPFLGVCLGMQVSLIEVARNILGLKDADSEEFAPNSENKVIVYMPEIEKSTMGANMRLGARELYIVDDEAGGPSSNKVMKTIYGGANKLTKERHRHRYEFNMEYYDRMVKEGSVRFTGLSDPSMGQGCRMEAIERTDTPKDGFYLAVQYHPEFVSSASDPSPPYVAFLAAAGKIPHQWPSGNSRGI